MARVKFQCSSPIDVSQNTGASEDEWSDQTGMADNTGFSTDHMDATVNPWENFYIFSSGTWIRNNPIPPNKTGWGTFQVLRERNDQLLGKILSRCSESDSSEDVEKMLGVFYRSAMDTDKLEKLKFSPVEPEIQAIDRIETMQDLRQEVIHLHLSGISPFFRVLSRPDEKNTDIYALYFWQGGLSLPDRDYYLSDSFSEIRSHYLKHIVKYFSMFGVDGSTAEKYSRTVMAIETDLAQASRSQTDLRDAEKNYNRVEIGDLKTRMATLNVDEYLAGMGIPAIDYVVVGQPEFLDFLDGKLKDTPLEDLKVYLKWQVLVDSAPFLHSEAETEHFDMFNRKLRGQEDPEPRWKRAARVIDSLMGEALGKLYVRDYFGKDARDRMSIMVEDIKAVFRDRLKTLPWMTEETRIKALAKFERFRTKIGHPDKFRDYSSIKIVEDDYCGNAGRSGEFEVRREMDRVGKDVDRDEWYMSPPTVNAYFSAPDNEIVFPAGILQPPFFDVSADVAVNYGAIGCVISHEITHGYDDQGRRYDEKGNLRDWWNKDDERNFLEKAQDVVKQYSAKEALPGLHVNGELTLGENIADFGGVSIAYEALQRRLQREPELRKTIDGFTPEQRFFISWAQVWKENIREQQARMYVTMDPHSPNKLRATLPVYNHPDFEKAFPNSGKSEKKSVIDCKVTIW